MRGRLRSNHVRDAESTNSYHRENILYSVLIVFCALNGCKRPSPTTVTTRSTFDARPSSSSADKQRHDELTSIGEVVGYNTVVVRTRVDGPLVQVTFLEGQTVKQGDLLAIIDPDTYRVALEEAVASRDKDYAALHGADASYRREQALYTEGIIAKQDLEKQEATFRQLEATVRADDAAVARAALDLRYTKITAPIEGRAGFRSVDVGNTVHSGDPSGIVTITQVSPILVIFSVPPQHLNQVLNLMQRHIVLVEILSEDGAIMLDHGELLTVDTAIDSSTGSARFKVRVPNSEHKMWPNEFVRVKLRLPSQDSR